MKKRLSIICLSVILCISAAACGNKTSSASKSSTENSKEEKESSINLKDGTYSGDFDTDSSMFRINESLKGKCSIKVENGKATAYIILNSKNIEKLFLGKAEDAKKDGATLIEPTIDKVKYEDGTTDEVYGFDVPLKEIDKEFNLAIIGTKGKWYDHKVKVSNVNPQ